MRLVVAAASAGDRPALSSLKSFRQLGARWLLELVLPLVLSGCVSFGANSYSNYQEFSEPSGQYRETPLASGQIVMTGSKAPTNILLGVMPQEFSPYIHLGIVMIDDGVPYVYDETGDPSLNLDPEVSPTSTIEGKVRRMPLERFVKRYFYAEIFEPAGADRAKVAEFARHHLAAETPFDRYFDYNDDSAFFCAEFVARAIEYGGGNRASIAPNRTNRSVSVVMDWLGVPEETIATSSLVDQSNPVMRMSSRSDSEILALNAVKREIHRRFTADQTIGNLFRWDGLRPVIRINGQRFLEKSLTRAKQLPPDPQLIEAEVRSIADGLYGPFISS
jgi:hypothetical protein